MFTQSRNSWTEPNTLPGPFSRPCVGEMRAPRSMPKSRRQRPAAPSVSTEVTAGQNVVLVNCARTASISMRTFTNTWSGNLDEGGRLFSYSALVLGMAEATGPLWLMLLSQVGLDFRQWARYNQWLFSVAPDAEAAETPALAPGVPAALPRRGRPARPSVKIEEVPC
jgi:hypothetical protein